MTDQRSTSNQVGGQVQSSTRRATQEPSGSQSSSSSSRILVNLIITGSWREGLGFCGICPDGEYRKHTCHSALRDASTHSSTHISTGYRNGYRTGCNQCAQRSRNQLSQLWNCAKRRPGGGDRCESGWTVMGGQGAENGSGPGRTGLDFCRLGLG